MMTDRSVKHLLIISESFAPKNAVASIRFTKTVKYLAMTGDYKIWVITTDPPLGEFHDELLAEDIASVKDCVNVVYISNQRLGKRIRQTKKLPDGNNKTGVKSSSTTFYVKGEKLSLKKRLKAQYLYYYQTNFADKSYKAAKDLMTKVKFDTIITTYGGIGSILAGLKIKRDHQDIRWIVDYRDVINAKTPYLIARQRRICEKADLLCSAITGATKDCVGSGKYSEKFTEITNAADSDDIRKAMELYALKDIAKEKVDCNQTSILNMCFSGSFYPGMDDAKPLFKMLAELISENKIDRAKIRLILMGKNPGEIIRTANNYNLGDILDVRGFVTRTESIICQKNSDILLMFTYNTKETGSFMHAKLMEYLMMDKKILCMVEGDCSGSFNGRLIRENGLGECYEKAQSLQDYDRVKSFIKAVYDEKMRGENVSYTTPEDIKDRFSSKTMAMKFDTLIRQIQ